MVRLSIYELEETVSIMVKSSQTTPDKLVKPTWWPVRYQFPLKRHASVHNENWREILHNLISKCYQFNNRERQRSKRPKPSDKHMVQREKNSFRRRNSSDSASGSSSSSLTSSNGRVVKQTKRRILDGKANNMVSIVNGRMRRDSTGSSVGSTVSSLSGGTVPVEKEEVPASATATARNQIDVCSGLVRSSGGDDNTSRSEISVAEVLATNLGLSQKLPKRVFSPIVQVYDVCKVNPSFIKFNNTNIKFKRNDYCDAIKRDINVEKSNFMNYFGLDTRSDAAMLPNVDDRSRNAATNAKLFTTKCNLVNCPHVPFSSNLGLKLIKDWHHYDNDVIEKRLERLERYLCNNDLPSLLTPVKDEFKIVNYKNSDPRSRLNHFYIFPTKKRHRRGKLTPKARFYLQKYCKPCFVNLSASGDSQIKNYLDDRKRKQIAIVDGLKMNGKEDKQKENKTPFKLLESRVVLTAIDKFKENASTSSLVVKTVDRSNFALQTLAPRNENSVQPPPTKLVNFANPSVVLQPIHELFEFTKRGKILHAAHKVARPSYKVVKTRVNVYNPRRFSTRLQEVINV